MMMMTTTMIWWCLQFSKPLIVAWLRAHFKIRRGPSSNFLPTIFPNCNNIAGWEWDEAKIWTIEKQWSELQYDGNHEKAKTNLWHENCKVSRLVKSFSPVLANLLLFRLLKVKWQMTSKMKGKINENNATLHLFWLVIWKHIWELTRERNHSNAFNVILHLFVRVHWTDIWKLTLEKSCTTTSNNDWWIIIMTFHLNFW